MTINIINVQMMKMFLNNSNVVIRHTENNPQLLINASQSTILINNYVYSFWMMEMKIQTNLAQWKLLVKLLIDSNELILKLNITAINGSTSKLFI